MLCHFANQFAAIIQNALTNILRANLRLRLLQVFPHCPMYLRKGPPTPLVTAADVIE